MLSPMGMAGRWLYRPTRRTLVLSPILAVILTIGAGYALLASPLATERMNGRLIAYLSERFDAEVQLGQIVIALVPRLTVEGRDLTLTRRGDREPFLRIEAFHVAGGPLQFLRRHVELATVEGLEVRIERGAPKPAVSGGFTRGDVTIGQLLVKRGVLLIVPKDPAKQPLQFDLLDVAVAGFALDRRSSYTAHLVNPKPRGTIESTGAIGPWTPRELGATPLEGRYVFADADLSTLPGLFGTLRSTGSFEGRLERIEVQGVTSTPDFGLTLAGHPMPLETRFRAVVDGTSGDTTLQEVHATLGQTRILANGTVTGQRGVPGRKVALSVTIDNGRFEDLLRLAVKSEKPPMQGTFRLQTAFELPPGKDDVPKRLRLAGQFSITRARSSNSGVQEKIDALSRRGRGQPTNVDVRHVRSTIGGRAIVQDGIVRVPRLRFRVDGALVDLEGSYRLQTAALDFRGTVQLDAPISKTMTGYKSFLLKAVDPLFRRKGAGAILPIKITGTAAQPSFGLDVGRVLRRD